MRIGVKGTSAQVQELSSLLSDVHDLVELKNTDLESYDAIFDLDFDLDASNYFSYAALQGKLVVVGAVRKQLEAMIAEGGKQPKCLLVGMNSLPGFIDRSILECTCAEKDATAASDALQALGLSPSFVKSRVGMVTPRIICMIINEAFYTVQEGTASRKDIDLGMKLGTAYPKGPFEWLDIIGIQNVYSTLDALYLDTRDERYKICADLKTEYLKSLV